MSFKSKLITIAFVVLTLIATLVRPYYLFITKTLQVSPIKALLSKDSLKAYDNQVNILFLGITPTGSTNEGPNLSDSIIVINYNLKNNKLTTISVPRDIWSETLGDKINSAYAYGGAKKKGGGFILAQAEIGAVVGLPIQYAVVADFNQFKELIDFLGEIEVNVENSFLDKKFPIAGRESDDCNGDKTYRCRYQTISFTKGKTHMNGETALNFVRSRNAEGDEGTDFAREKRQQKVIEAVKNQLIKIVKNVNLKTYNQLYQVLDKLIKRDITNQQVTIIAKNILLKRNFSQNKIVLGEEFFTNPEISEKYNNLWVLIPKDNNFNTIHQYVSCQLNQQKNCDNLKPKREENS